MPVVRDLAFVTKFDPLFIVEISSFDLNDTIVLHLDHFFQAGFLNFFYCSGHFERSVLIYEMFTFSSNYAIIYARILR